MAALSGAPLSSRQHVEQMVHFGVHLAGRGHRIGDLRPEQLPIPLAQAMHRYLDRSLLHAQLCRELCIGLGCAVTHQAGLEGGKQIGLVPGTELRFEPADDLIQQGQCPPVFEGLLGRPGARILG